MKIHHIALKVSDLEKCERFYAGQLGLSLITRHNDERGHLRSIWLDCGGVILMLEKSESVQNIRAQGWHLVALTIDAGEREEWKARLTNAGIKIENESQHSIYFRDPEGNRLALSHSSLT